MAIQKWCKQCKCRLEKCVAIVEHRKHHCFRADVQPGGRTGERFRESFDSQSEAKAWIHERKQEFKSRDKAESRRAVNMQIDEFIDDYWNLHCTVAMRRPERDERYRLNKFKNFFKCTLLDFNIKQADKFIASLEKYDIDYKNRLITSLKAMTNWGFSRGYFTVNPLLHLKRLKSSDVNTVRTRWLDDAEIARLLAACESDRLRDMVLFGINTGFRKENIVDVRIEDIDLRAEFITAKKTKQGKPYDVPIFPSYRPHLLRLIGNRTSGRLFSLTSWEFVRAFQRASLKAGMRKGQIPELEWVTPHVLRHTFAAHLIKAGKSIYAVSKWLGHSSIKMTELVYGHLCRKFQKEHVSDVQIGPVGTFPEGE